MNHLVNLSEAASLGFHGLALIAREAPRRLNTREAAGILGVSEAHLAKVFQTLVKAELITSRRGPAGGFVLNRSPGEISFLQVYEAVESPVTLSHCPAGGRECGFSTCIFGGEMNRINREILDLLKDIKLSRFSTESGLKENT